MAKLCAKGKAAAKRKFKVYPSAYANMYASAVCSGKVTPGGKKKNRKPGRQADAKKTGGRVGYKKGKLVGGQKKLDANKDGKISKADFALLKKKKKKKKTKKSK